jgi:predicted nuclease of predicted toxin-antitoxin system
VKLLLDEMLSAVIAERLRGRGHDVSAVQERSELRGLADPDLFEHAQHEQRAIVTYNRDDFLALAREYRAHGREHPGVIILNPRRFPQAAATTGPLITALGVLPNTGSPYPAFVHWLQ